MTDTLDCGHTNDWNEGFSARDANERSMCKACAHAAELELLRVVPRFFAYLSPDGKTLTDWAGGLIATVHGTVRKSGAKSPTMGYNPRGLWTFRAKDVHGTQWTCRHWPDSGDYVRMTRIKVKP